ncbi:hypothetical protein V2J09_019507 [Rumex salicifolius]
MVAGSSNSFSSPLFLVSLFLAYALFAPLHFAEAAAAAAPRQKHRNRGGIKHGRFSRGTKQMGNCNLFQGKWVFDDSVSPLYNFSSCPFTNPEFDCLKYGRPDKQFLKYTWVPDSCVLPSFDGLELLKKWKGKKIMFVGDSLSLNQFNSLGCMVHASVPEAKYTFTRIGLLTSINFLEYDVNIMLYHSTYLVDVVGEAVGVVLKLDSIRAGDAWKDMDVLIFNSWHWWTHHGKSQGWDYMEEGSKLYKDMDRLTAFYKGLTTWANWADQNVNTSKTQVFFQGISPTHYNGREWNAPMRSCSGQADPLSGSSYPAGIPPEAEVVKKVLGAMKTPVYLLDITTLSQLRKDCHPSAYSGDHSGTDCSHWCLPGLPDTWNELLYAAC